MVCYYEVIPLLVTSLFSDEILCVVYMGVKQISDRLVTKTLS